MPDITFVDSTEDAMECLRWLGQPHDGPLAIDTETGGFDWHSDKLRLFQIGDTQDAWVISFDRFKGLVWDVLSRWDGELVGHNLPFDQRFLEGPQGFNKQFLDQGRLHDTMLAVSLVEPDKRKGLKPASARLIDPRYESASQALDDAMDRGKWTWKTVPEDLPQYWGYAGFDTIITAQLHAVLQVRMRELEVLSAYELERECRAACTRMEQVGLPLDQGYCEAKAQELRAFAAKARDWAQATYGIKSLGSNDEIIAHLRMDGIQLTKETASGGKMSLDEEVLTSPLVQQHPLAQAVLGHRKAVKLASTYFESFLAKQHGGRLFPSINTVQARTGRMSVDNPAMQTLPRGPVVRNAIAAGEGCSIISADYQGIEARVFAHYADESHMIEMFRRADGGETLDFHTMNAQVIYGLGDALPTKQQRDISKNALFAWAYGAGPRKYALTAGIDESAAKDVYARYERVYPKALGFKKSLIEGVLAQAYESGQGIGFVRNTGGRFHPVDADKAYTAVNYQVQGECGDVLKRAIVNCARAGLGEYMRLPVHDELVLEVPTAIADDIRKALVDNMTDTTTYRLPLAVVAAQPARTWGEAK